MANILEAIGGMFTDWTGTWDKFRNGDANVNNLKMNEENIASQEAINQMNVQSQEKMNLINAQMAEAMNQANLRNQTDINNANLRNQTDINNANMALQAEMNQANLNNQQIVNNSNINLTKEQNELNRRSQEAMNYASLKNQTEINNQNIALQRETNAKNEQLMREQWYREDNAYSRTIDDMKRNGISPLAMQGLNPTGGMTQMQAPQAQASAQFGATNYDRAQINAPEMKATHLDATEMKAIAQFQRAEQKAVMMTAPQARFQAMASGMADIAMEAIGKGVQAKQFSEQMQIREMELDTQKMQKAKDQLQAESQLAETIRHNEEMEKQGNWKNKLANGIINKLTSEDATGNTPLQSGVDRIKETATNMKNSEVGNAMSTMSKSLTATATGNKDMQQEAFTEAYKQGKRISDKIENGWKKVKSWFRKK